jgi:hypothetical protein
MMIEDVALWALVIALGLQTGAGIYETRVILPLWASDPPSSVTAFFGRPSRPDSGKRLWIFLSPLTMLITIVNLVLALRSDAPDRTWWITGAALGLAVLVATFAYFVPVLNTLPRAAELPPAQVAAMVRRWVALNYVRLVMIIAAWLAALRAFS